MSTCFPKKRERIIEFIVCNPGREIKVRDIAKQLRISPAHVSRTLKTFHEYGMFKNNKVDLSNPYVRALKIFLNVKKLMDINIVEKLQELAPKGVGMYGSWANGSNYEDSDLDGRLDTVTIVEVVP